MKLLFIFILILSSTLNSVAEELRVGVDPQGYPPYYYWDDDDTLTGFSVELFELLADKAGYQVIYKEYPWSRIHERLREAEIDVVLLYLKTDQREQFTRYSKIPYLYESYYLFQSGKDKNEYDGSFESLINQRIGTVRGYSYGKKFDQLNLKRESAVGTELQLIDMLARNRLDYIIVNQAVMNYHIQESNLTDIYQLKPRITRVPAFIGFSKNTPNSELITEKFSKLLMTFIESPTYQKLLNRYAIEPTN